MELLGVEIGGTKLQVVRGDERGKIETRWHGDVKPGSDAAAIRKQIIAGLEYVAGSSKAAAIGVGFGGPVDWKSGQVARSHQVAGWTGFELGRWLSDESGIPAFVDNDANVAALGEATLGAGKGLSPAFYVTLGSGVGGGLIVDGHIYHGAPPGEAEFGHVRLDPAGTTVESRCSGWAIDQRVRQAIASGQSPALSRLSSDHPRASGGEARWLPQALAEGDPLAERILLELGNDLGFALSHVVHLLHPQLIVLGGGLSLLGEPLIEAVAKALTIRIMEVFAPGPKLCTATLGPDAVPAGALLLAASRLARRGS